MVGLVEWIDSLNGYPWNIWFIHIRVYTKPDDPLLMGFLMKLDNNLCVWIQIIASIQRQLRRIRNTFDVNIGINFFEIYFVNSTCAFVHHPKKRTTTIILIFEIGLLFYHLANIQQAYINDNLDLSFCIKGDSSQSLH